MAHNPQAKNEQSRIRIRDAWKADEACLVAFHLQLYRDYRRTIVPADLGILYDYRDFEEILRGDVRALLSEPQCIVLIAETEQGAMGYVTGRITLDPRRLLTRKAILEDWFVLPEAREQHIGRALIDELLERFRAASCDVIETRTWPYNNRTRKLFQQLGFHETEIVYRKQL